MNDDLTQTHGDNYNLYLFFWDLCKHGFTEVE